MRERRDLADAIEEKFIAAILGAMTIITFANVIARYGFNANILWALEITVFLFAWLVLLGASYAVKKGSHLGVDILINILPPQPRRFMGLCSAAICIAFFFLMFKGAWDYWANFANLPATEGRWFPLGFEEKFRGKGWYEVNDIPMIGLLGWMETVFNNGETYEKIPRLLPYSILPLSMALMLYRCCQAAYQIWTGKTDRIVASHEVEEEIESAREKIEEAG
ncbi:MAG: TRAP transporter small permease [Rhodospirillales bacterium]|jgi:C4-dicarboxylate transporter, DctQ subunit|nr:TRAP transporter small permease [Rhodospirillales bacterium]MBT3906452.1 TRAP transporter small permease [Rhodospirillaceae bacterium]MBT5034353.1 TRAP transporter small permease [Rhodospirillaceae bacterium]MBT6219838.1 TRAP transporter small permease [Rhodospirillaceae bacterium]MBT7485457.1 TRAP transporter small permease [Rhodospirillales bacterium]